MSTNDNSGRDGDDTDRAAPDPAHVPTHPWWPAGCPVGRVRDCARGGCEACTRLLARHDAIVAGRPVTAAGDASLASFGGERA